MKIRHGYGVHKKIWGFFFGWVSNFAFVIFEDKHLALAGIEYWSPWTQNVHILNDGPVNVGKTAASKRRATEKVIWVHSKSQAVYAMHLCS